MSDLQHAPDCPCGEATPDLEKAHKWVMSSAFLDVFREKLARGESLTHEEASQLLAAHDSLMSAYHETESLRLPAPEPAPPELIELLEAHRRFHGKVGCAGDDCYVCQAEDRFQFAARSSLPVRAAPEPPTCLDCGQPWVSLTHICGGGSGEGGAP